MVRIGTLSYWRRRTWRRRIGLSAGLLAVLGGIPAGRRLSAQQQGGGDIPPNFAVPTTGFDYVKREAMIPMRDGVKLHTVIVVPKDARNAPILLTRTPYEASKRTARNNSPHMLATLPQGDEVFVAGGYIRVFQDVRGSMDRRGTT